MAARPRLGRAWDLEDRIAPANVVTHPVVQFDPDGRPLPNPAFDAGGRALSGNKARVDDALLRLFNAYLDHGPGWAAAEPDDARDLQVDAAGRALVRVTAADVAALRPALEGIGFAEVGAAPASLLIEGWLPVAALPAAEALAGQGLFGILPVLRPQTSAGTVTSQADWVMSADRVRAALPAGYDGSGVRVGVLSDSYNSLGGAAADLAGGDLGPVQVIQDIAGGTDEGRAMLQLVHDVAPGAGLAFATAFGGETGFATNIRQLADPAVGNARVVVDDVFYYAEPYFQPGVVAQAIQEVYNTRGVTYFSSAGNQADSAWERLNPATAAGTAYSVTGTLYDFDPGAGTDFQQRVTIPNGGVARIGLQWDQPFYTLTGVASDLDVFLFRADTGALVASSVANNPADRTPWEFIGYGNNTGQSAFDVVIQHFSGPAVSRVKYKFYNNLSLTEFATGSPTISSHGGIPEAVGVAAVPYYDQRVRESFTSSGPMTILFDAAGNRLGAPIVAPGPVLAAPDGTNTTFFGGDAEGDGFRNFFGTSAAAPHAAAVAALVRQAFPGLAPAQVIERLVDSADTNTDAPGFDKYTGWGLIDAHRAIFGTTPSGAGGSFQETFESGVLGPQWEAYSTAAGRIQVTGGFTPLAGARHVVLHNQFGEVPGATGPSNGRNELTLHVDPLAAGSNGILLFSEKEFSDEDHAMPATFVGGGDYDGVAFSPDGSTWYRLASLTGAASTNAYQAFGFNLPAAASAAGVALTRDTRIRFQQFDNSSAANDGIAFDNISFGVNQAPAFTKGADQAVTEDALPQSIAGWATAISAGPAALGLEAGQTVSFEVVSNSNPGLFAVAPAVGPTGTLTYTPAANANGFADIAVRVKDNGGTAGGGIDASATQTFRITVNAVNDAPAFLKGADETVLEDAGLQTVPNWATAISAGPPDEGGQTLTFQVVGNTNPALFAVAPAISSTGTLTYTPAPNASGTASISIALQDNGGGTNTSAPQAFTITVTAVNDVPGFTAGTGPTINEDAGPQSLPAWATAISAGPAESQVLTFDVSTNNDALFTTLPAVSPTGTLTYTAAPQAFGSAVVTVRLHDNGGTANGGVDASGPQTFALTVNPVNDAPGFTPGGNVTVIEDAGPQAVAEWATNIAVGPANEGGQVPTFEIVSNNNPGLFAVGPTVSPVGTLRFTPAPNANGSATIQVRVRDGGGTANGGVDVSPPATLTITLTPVNDAPVANPDAPISGTSGSILIDVLGNDADVDGDTLTIQSFTQPAGGRVVQVGQQLQYTPKVRTLGADPFTYTITDGNGLTATATVTVDMRELNPPVVTGMRIGYGPGKSAAVPNRPAVFGWSSITTISVTFSEAVSVALDDLTVTGQAGPLPVTGVQWDPATWTATWTLAQPLGTDRVTVRLDGGPGGVLGLGNNFPLVGGDFVRSFGVLWGDLDGNGLVTRAELAKVKRLIGKRYPSLAGADVDGDGVVTKKDLALVKANVGKRV